MLDTINHRGLPFNGTTVVHCVGGIMKVRDFPMMRIRISPELKELLKKAAESSNRTLNSEVCHQLEKAYGLKDSDMEAA